MGSILYRLANLQFLNAKPVTTKNRSQYNTCIYNLINDVRILFKVDLSKYYYQVYVDEIRRQNDYKV